MSYSFYGIDNIKESLINGKKLEEKNISIIYRIIEPPRYECIIYSYNENEGINLMNKSLNEVEKTIKSKGGYFIMENKPTVVIDKKNKFW